jgi:hypothetical protein
LTCCGISVLIVRRIGKVGGRAARWAASGRGLPRRRIAVGSVPVDGPQRLKTRYVPSLTFIGIVATEPAADSQRGRP